MATKQEIVKDLRQNYGLMLNVTEVTKALGFSDKRAALRFLEGLPRCDMGREKKYLARDIANRIYESFEP